MKRALLLIAALLVPALAFVAPANAEDPAPIPTTTRFFATPRPASATDVNLITANARVKAASGIPTGTVRFIGVPSGDLLATVPVDATGLAKAVVSCTGQGAPFCGRVRAEFTGTNGYGDSDSRDFNGGTQTMNPEPTLIKIGGPGLLKINLTMSATITFADGSPVEGVPVYFTLLSPASLPGHGTPLIETPSVCTAWSDANGLASCGGQAAVASLVSALAGGYANRSYILSFESVKLPAVTVVK